MSKSSFRNPSRASSVRRPQFDFSQLPDLFNFSVGADDKLRVKLKPNADMQSDNFEEDVAGWRIEGSGDVEFDNGTFRGRVEASSGFFDGTIFASDGIFKGAIEAGPLTMSNTLTGLPDYDAVGKRADIVYSDISGEIGANKVAYLSSNITVTRVSAFGSPSTFVINRISVTETTTFGFLLNGFEPGGAWRFLARYDDSGTTVVDQRLVSQSADFNAQGVLYRLTNLPGGPGSTVGDIYEDTSGYLRITQ
jgi:hypothetical protein